MGVGIEELRHCGGGGLHVLEIIQNQQSRPGNTRGRQGNVGCRAFRVRPYGLGYCEPDILDIGDPGEVHKERTACKLGCEPPRRLHS